MSSVLSAAANLAKLCIGVGVLALPFATAVGGLLFAPLTIAVVAVWNAVACKKMIECKNACVQYEFPSHLSSTFSRIAYAGAGSFGVALTDFSIIVTLIGVCIAYQITFAKLLQEVPFISWGATELTVAFGILALPLCCVPDVGVLAVFSLVGLICLVTSVIAIVVYGVELYGSEVHLASISTHSLAPPLWPQTLAGTASFVGVATFCFGICSCAFPIEESMADKTQFGTAVVWSLAFVWVVYVLFGDLGALLYAHDPAGVKDNILANLPTDSFVALLVRLTMTGVSLLTYPLTLVPPAQMIEHYVTTYLWSANAHQSAAFASAAPRKGYGAVEENGKRGVTAAPSSESSPLNGGSSDVERDQGDVSSSANEAQSSVLSSRLVVRGLIVLATTIIATFIPCFGMVIALLGGFTVTILGFILPTYLHLQIIGYGRITGYQDHHPRSPLDSAAAQERKSVVDWDIAQTAMGVVLCAVATGVTVGDFVSELGKPGGQCG